MRRRKRTNATKKADALLISDLHITDSPPISRTDNYMQAQETKLKFMRKLSEKNNNCPILCSGDIFDKWKASPWLCAWACRHIPQNYLFITIPGNHDLPGHSIKQYDKSALALLEQVCDCVHALKGMGEEVDGMHITGVPAGQIEEFLPALDSMKFPKAKTRALMLHELVWEKQKPVWAKSSYSAEEILDMFSKYFDLILTGDNHQSFMVKQGRTLLVNPGSMMRRTADQVDFQPKCYLYYSDSNTVKAVKLPIEKDVHDTTHLDNKKERDGRITAYIEKMQGSWETGMSFKNNLEAFFAKNNTPKKVREIVWQAMEAN